MNLPASIILPPSKAPLWRWRSGYFILFVLLFTVSQSYAEPVIAKQAANVLRENSVEIGADYNYLYKQSSNLGINYLDYSHLGILYVKYGATDEVEVEINGKYLYRYDDIYTAKSWGLGPISIGGKFCFFRSLEFSIAYGFGMDLPFGDSKYLLVEGFNIYPYFAWDLNAGSFLVRVNLGFNMRGDYIDPYYRKIKKGDMFFGNLAIEVPIDRLRLLEELTVNAVGTMKINGLDEGNTAGWTADIFSGFRWNIDCAKFKAGIIFTASTGGFVEYNWKIIAGIGFLLNL